jgi:glycerol-3-phosphate dehydrogenase (NAD(P)+)
MNASVKPRPVRAIPVSKGDSGVVRTRRRSDEKPARSQTVARPARTKIAVLGAGNMGTALAHALACGGHDLTVWDFFPEVVDDIRTRRENRRFLPGVRLSEGIRAVESPVECVTGAALVAVCVPSVFVRSTLAPVIPALGKGAYLLNVAKGFAPGTRQILPLWLEQLAPGHACVHLAGPAIAPEFARGQTASVVLASSDASAAQSVAGWLAGPYFIAGTTSDVAGAVLGGILKNVYAILLGCLETLSGHSRNLEAAVVTASVREMAAIAVAHGGHAGTLLGLAGLGDLVVTGFSPVSRNRRFGQLLAAGRSVAAIERETGWLPEGARGAAAACALARSGGVSAPLARWVNRLLAGTPPTLAGLVRALRLSQQGRPQ